MDVLIYVTEDNKIIKQPLQQIENKFTCNLATRGFVIGANVRTTNVRIPQNFLSPLEAYHQDNPYYMNLHNLAKDDFRGQNETFEFSL